MSLLHITKDGKCAYCGAVQAQCAECSSLFHKRNSRHILCSSRCITRRYRRKKQTNL